MRKYHWLPFFVWCISGSRAFSAFLVEDGALMIVASTIVPVATFSPFAAKCRCTSSNSYWPDEFTPKDARPDPNTGGDPRMSRVYAIIVEQGYYRLPIPY